MFRKPKRKVKDALRKKDETAADASVATKDDDDDEVDDTSELLQDARKRVKSVGKASARTAPAAIIKDAAVMHTYETKTAAVHIRDLVTSTADHHPENDDNNNNNYTAKGAEGNSVVAPTNDGIYRGERKEVNAFHAGPIRAAAHVRVTARFDYQPDICKDYKETGFCGFGDTCIYLHDRGDTVSGWQLEQQWEQQQKIKKEKQQQEMIDFATGKVAATEDGTAGPSAEDGIPFACHICRDPFKNPVATNCGHYFCETCIMNHVRTVSEACPVCGKDTGSVFNLPSKLIAKKRKVLGAAKAKEQDSWDQYAKAFQGETKM